MVHKFHLPIQTNILVWLFMTSYGGKSRLRKVVMSSTSSSGRRIGYLDAILSCQSTINSYYTSKLYVQLELGIQLWGCANDSNIQVIQRQVLKCIVNAPWYVRNSGFHRDLGIETVTDIIATFANSHEKRLQDHINIESSRLLNVKQYHQTTQTEETVWTS
jgi:hypothetical protein